MNIKDLETADCPIKKIRKTENEILIHFSEIYNIGTKKYENDVILIIRNWTSFVNKLYISQKPFSKGVEKILSEAEFEIFEEISRKSIHGNNLILEGFSKDLGHWMEYTFEEFEYEIINASCHPTNSDF